MSKGMVLVTSSPLRFAHSAENYVEHEVVFLLLLPSCYLFSSFGFAASFSFLCFLHHAQNCREGPAGAAGSGNV